MGQGCHREITGLVHLHSASRQKNSLLLNQATFSPHQHPHHPSSLICQFLFSLDMNFEGQNTQFFYSENLASKPTSFRWRLHHSTAVVEAEVRVSQKTDGRSLFMSIMTNRHICTMSPSAISVHQHAPYMNSDSISAQLRRVPEAVLAPIHTYLHRRFGKAIILLSPTRVFRHKSVILIHSAHRKIHTPAKFKYRNQPSQACRMSGQTMWTI